jgi:hypothetical protein
MNFNVVHLAICNIAISLHHTQAEPPNADNEKRDVQKATSLHPAARHLCQHLREEKCNTILQSRDLKRHLKQRERRLEVLIEVEVSTVLSLGLNLRRSILVLLLCAGHDACFLVVTNSFLEEVGLASEGDILHEIEWVGDLVVLLVSESNQEAISDEFDILLHKICIHAQESTRKSLGQEFLLDGDSFSDNTLNSLLAWSVLQMGEEQTSEVGVETLVTRDQLVREGEPSHQPTLLQPEDGCEGTTEEDTLNSGKCHEALSEGGRLVLNPPDSPIGLLLDARNCETVLVYRKRNFSIFLLVSIALKRYVRWVCSLIYVSMRSE